MSFQTQKKHIYHHATFRVLGQLANSPQSRDLQAEWTKWQKQLREWRQSYDVPWDQNDSAGVAFFLLKSDGFPKGTPQKHNYTKKKQHSMETIWQEIPPPRKEKNRMGDFDKGSDRFWEKCPKVRWGIFYQQAAVN